MDGITTNTVTPARRPSLGSSVTHEPAAGTSPATSSPSADRSDTVAVGASLGGHDLVMTRLFGRGPHDPEPPVRSPHASTQGSFNGRECLTTSDRAFVAGLYETAQNNGIDLVSVDRIAEDMAHIRFMSDASPATDMTDLDGNPLPVKFTAEDQAAVNRIAASPAMNDTAFPKDLLSSFMDPGKTWIHASDYRDLEAIVNATSPSTVATTTGGVKALFEKARTYPQSPPPDPIPTLDQATIDLKLRKNLPPAELSERDKKTLAVLALLDGQSKDHMANLFAQVALTGHDPAIVDAFATRSQVGVPRSTRGQESPRRHRVDTTA